MKKNLFTVSVLALAIALTGCKNDKAETKALTINEQSSEVQKAGYALGFEMGTNAKEVMDDLDLDAVQQGLKDAYAGKEMALDKEKLSEAIEVYMKRKQEEAVKKMEEKAKTNKSAGEAFLAENAKKEGVKTTASGLQYKVITEGTGKSPKATDSVVVHYEGKLIDGKVFDSSYERGEPIEFPLNQVIAGWTEGLQLMKEGGTYELYIPSDLAYGETGNPGIEPNSTLIFKIELLDEKAANAAREKAKAEAEKQMAEMIAQMQAAQAQAGATDTKEVKDEPQAEPKTEEKK